MRIFESFLSLPVLVNIWAKIVDMRGRNLMCESIFLSPLVFYTDSANDQSQIKPKQKKLYVVKNRIQRKGHIIRKYTCLTKHFNFRVKCIFFQQGSWYYIAELKILAREYKKILVKLADRLKFFSMSRVFHTTRKIIVKLIRWNALSHLWRNIELQISLQRTKSGLN